MPEVLQKGNKPTTPVTAKDTIDFYSGGGKVGRTKEDLRGRGKTIDAAVDGTNDPTSVEYGGNRGSSVNR